MSTERDADEILRHLARHGVPDKDRAPPRPTRARPRARARGGIRTLDLHGMTSDRASSVLRQTLYDCRTHGVPALLVIHGRGIHSAPGEEAVLKSMVHRMAGEELAQVVRDMRTAPPAQGGEGATILYL